MSNETEKLSAAHPPLMVPRVYTLSVVIYSNGDVFKSIPTEAVRDVLVANLPAGFGVSTVYCTDHGVYVGPQGASA